MSVRPLETLLPTEPLENENALSLVPRIELNLTVYPSVASSSTKPIDERKLKRALIDFLKTSLSVSITVPEEDLQIRRFKDDKNRKRSDPLAHATLCIRDLRFLTSKRDENEDMDKKFREWKKYLVEKIDSLELNLQGDKLRLNVIVDESDDFEGMRKAGEELNAFGNRGYPLTFDAEIPKSFSSPNVPLFLLPCRASASGSGSTYLAASHRATSRIVGEHLNKPQTMERTPEACAMEWSIELEKALRSKKSGRPIEAIEQFGKRLCWWSKEPEPTRAVYSMFGLVHGEDRLFANAILLRLADAFRLGDKGTRVAVVRLFLLELKNRQKRKKCREYKGILSKGRVHNNLELLKRVKVVFDTGDVESRALALVLFGCWADFAKDNAHIRYLIFSALISTDVLEVKGALFAAGCFSELAGDFAAVVLEMLINMLTSSETPSILRIPGIRVLEKMCCSSSIARSAYKMGLKLVFESNEEDILVATLVSLSKLASKSTLLISEQVDLLLSFFSREHSLRLQATTLRCLHFIFSGGVCHPSVCTPVIKILFKFLDGAEIPSTIQHEALQILHKIFSHGTPNLAQDNMLEFPHLLTIVENSTPTISNKLVAIRILVDITVLFRERKEVQSSEDFCSSLLLRILSVIADQIMLLVKPLFDLYQSNTRLFQDVQYLLGLLLFLVREHPDVSVLVLDKVRVFTVHIVDLCDTNIGARQADMPVDETMDFGGDKNPDSRLKLLHIVHKFCVTCIERLNDVGPLPTQILEKIKLLVESVHQCRAFDCYTHIIYSLLLHSKSVWGCVVNKDEDTCLDGDLYNSLCDHLAVWEISSLENANKMLKGMNKWPAYKAGIFAAYQGAWVTAAFIFDQLTSKAKSESCSYWLKLLALFTQSESKIELFLVRQLESSLIDWSKRKGFPLLFREHLSRVDQRALQNTSEPNFSQMLAGVYDSAPRETFESVIKLSKSFCFQRWFLVLRTKVLGSVVDLLNVMDTIPLDQGTSCDNEEVECLNTLHKISELSFRFRRLAEEYDLIATSFIGVDSRSSKIISALALSCSLLAFASGFAILLSDLPAFKTFTPYSLESSQNSLRQQLIQSLVGRLCLIDQETCSHLFLLLEVSGQPKDCSHLQVRTEILRVGSEVRDLLSVCNYVVCGVVRLRNEANRVHSGKILLQVTRDGVVLLLDAIKKYLHIPFQVPKYFFKVRPLVGSELFVHHADSINPIELSVLPGFHLSLNLCFQLRNLPPDLLFQVTKSYCILYSNASFREPISFGSTHEQVCVDHDFSETDSMIQQNKNLLFRVMEITKKTYNGKRPRDKETGNDDGTVQSIVCFELNDTGQGFSSCLLDVSDFPVGSYRIKWHSCCIDSRGSYWSLLPLNAGPIFTVKT